MIITARPSLVQWSFEGSAIHRFKPITLPCLSKISVRIKSNERRIKINCGLRASYKKKPPSKVISKEAIQVIQALKLAKSSPQKIDQILKERFTRLLKDDVLDVLSELQRQNYLDLSLKVFELIREEEGYGTMLSLYSDMIMFLGRRKMIEEAEGIFCGVMERGLRPDTRMHTEMIGAYIQVGMMEKAMEIYSSMKELGCKPDRLTFMILIRNLEKVGDKEMAEALKEECFQFVDYPDKFIQEVEHKQKHAKKRSLHIAEA
ncbi:hypothetical protein HN51_042722 [Arachis hypogaea]|uniref:Pentacotripeptide-repeat region of PRORP domain-containing protein n=1 Tax=Arachis hypogaea TaxID=3818 RepID=A0A444Y8J2_ARAHY|nr:pentatricopeptide repeat-containing protein At1g62350 [Arachis ipaensis]XP_025670883.1 pentatricopeptide repeat-containing protein At1g62350 [Arachis hypogaea]RYQ98282.1 hypothetical protein Ahy_B08g094332 [Arachis hypogaea]